MIFLGSRELQLQPLEKVIRLFLKSIRYAMISQQFRGFASIIFLLRGLEDRTAKQSGMTTVIIDRNLNWREKPSESWSHSKVNRRNRRQLGFDRIILPGFHEEILPGDCWEKVKCLTSLLQQKQIQIYKLLYPYSQSQFLILITCNNIFFIVDMPKAKKDQVVSLTKVKPKTREHKEYIVEKAQLFLKKFKYVYLLSFDNMTTNNFKSLKEALDDSKFLMGKNRVLATAFGIDEESSFKPNSFRIGELMKGHCSLFFTNRKPEEVNPIFDQFTEEEYATGGNIAERTIILYQGFDSLKRFSHSMEPHFRKLGLPTRLVNSKIELLNDYMICEEGKPITVENCKVLKHLDIKMARLKFSVKAIYDGKNFKQYV